MTVVNTVINIKFQYREQNFFTSGATLSFSRRVLLHAVGQLVHWLIVGLIFFFWSVSQTSWFIRSSADYSVSKSADGWMLNGGLHR
jgi:hypothetical protein